MPNIVAKNPFVKSEYNRDSAIVAGFGRIVASTVTPAGSEAILVADVPLRAGVPLATRLGDWVAWLCVIASAARILLSSRRRRLVSAGAQRLFSGDTNR